MAARDSSSADEQSDFQGLNNEPEKSDDEERSSIRAEISTLSFEDLQKLKEKIGAKVYKEALFGKRDKKDKGTKIYKRENKNRPRETTSKKPVPLIDRPSKFKKTEIRDPRFDPLCGQFDKKEFNENYNFLSEMRLKDMKAIRSELKNTDNPEKEIKLRRLLQRLNDQQKSNKKELIEKKKKEQEKLLLENDFKEGKQPHFKNKSELKVETLIKQYEELKKEGSGRIQRHIKRRQQKIKKRSFRDDVERN